MLATADTRTLADQMRSLKRARAFLFANRQCAKQRGDRDRVASLNELLRLNKAAIVRLGEQIKEASA